MSGKVKMILLLVLLIILIASGLFYFLKPQKSNKEIVFTTTPGNVFSKETPTPKVIPGDFPPLYPGVEWNSPKSVEKIRFRDENNSFFEVDGISVQSGELKTYPTLLINYYEEKLTSSGWNKTWSASGEGGESYGFQKNDKYIQFGILILPTKTFKTFVEYN